MIKITMKKAFLLACLLSFAFLIANASAIEISVTPSLSEVRVGEIAWYTIKIYNNQDYADEFIISIFGPHLEWLNLQSYYVFLGPGNNKEVKMFFYPQMENTYVYEIMVYSKNDIENKAIKKITLKVLPEKEVRITDLSSRKINENLEVSFKLYSKELRKLKINLLVLDGKGNEIKTKEIIKEVQGFKDIKETIPVNDLLAGAYRLKAEIKEFDINEETTFTIPVVHNVITKKEVNSGPFGEEVVITIINEGNTNEDYVFTETLPSSQYLDFAVAPSNAYVGGENAEYRWKVEGLAVGKSTTIKYTKNKLPFIIGSFIMIFCLVVLLGMAVVKVRVPFIDKTHVKRKGEHVIILHIKGSLTTTLKGVIVKDRVTPLAKVVPEFDGPKPVVREGEDIGTELIWHIGDLKPRSEIYLSYKIKPLVEAQLKMPRAYMSYKVNEEETKMRVFSKQIIIET